MCINCDCSWSWCWTRGGGLHTQIQGSSWSPPGDAGLEVAGKEPHRKHHHRPRGVPLGAGSWILREEADGGSGASGDGRGHPGVVLSPGHTSDLQAGVGEGGFSLSSRTARLLARHPCGHVHGCGPRSHRGARQSFRGERVEAHHRSFQLGGGVEDNFNRAVHPQRGEGAPVGAGKVQATVFCHQ